MTNEEIAVSLTHQHDKLKSLEHRVQACENENESIRSIAFSVNKLAINMEHMLAEQKEQGKRLTALERVPIERFGRIKDIVIKCCISSVLGALLGALLALLLR